jgi:hypothetical protein
MSPRTIGEQTAIAAIGDRLDRLTSHLRDSPRPSSGSSASEWFSFLASMKAIVGNSDNDASLIAGLMARDYLSRRLTMAPYCAAAKAQGAPGLDIDERTSTGERVIGEIKTTEPYKPNDLGAQQKTTFRKDFAKLNDADAPHRFFFVTSRRTFELMRRKYASEIPGVAVVLLPDGDELVGQPVAALSSPARTA